MCVKKLTVVFSLLSLFLFLIVTELDVAAAPKSVNDCINDEADCESTETNGAEKENNEDKTALLDKDTDADPLWLSFVKLIIALLLVLGLIYLLLLFLKRKNALFNQAKAIENIAGISVGQNKSLQIVRLGKKYYLIGVGDNVELLQEITDESVIDDLRKEGVAYETATLPKFLQKFNHGSKNMKINDQTNFKRQFTRELDKLKQNRNQLIQQFAQKEDRNE